MSLSVSPFGTNGINNTSPPLRRRLDPSTLVPSLPVVLAPQIPVLTHTEMNSVDTLSDNMEHIHLSGREQCHVKGQLSSENLPQYALDVNILSKQHYRPEVPGKLKEKARELTSAGVNCLQLAKPQDLALLVDGFLKVCRLPDMDEVTDVLALAAGEVNRRSGQGSSLSQWSAEQLAVVANGLGRCEGGEIQGALRTLAREVKGRVLTLEQGWSAEHLAMMVEELNRGEWYESQGALRALARAVMVRELTLRQGWNAGWLARMAKGFSQGEGGDIQGALRALASAVEGRELNRGNGWSVQHVAMMIGGIGQILYGHPVFCHLMSALRQQGVKAPFSLITMLNDFARFSLSPIHLVEASKRLSALRESGFIPDSQRQKDELLWCITLFHFACSEQQSDDKELGTLFKEFYKHYHQLLGVQSGNGTFEPAYEGQWHIFWARKYWQPSCSQNSNVDGLEKGTVSHWQYKIFNKLRRKLPDSELAMKVPVNGFFVDIMIDGSICVEVDGPRHFVSVPQNIDEKISALSADIHYHKACRTKELFIDHMLKRYGYQVFRIAVSKEQGNEAAFIDKVVSAVNEGKRYQGYSENSERCCVSMPEKEFEK